MKKLFFFIICKKNLIFISNKYKIYLPWSVKVGINSHFEGNNKIGQKTKFSGNIGFNSYIGEQCSINADIGRFCSISEDVKTISGTHPTSMFVSTSPAFYSLQKSVGTTFTKKKRFNEYKKINDEFDVIIGNDVCISSGVRIIGGVRIDDGAIIGANTVVTKNVPSYAIVAGVPGKIIGYRFNQNQIKDLLEISWWNFSNEKLISLVNEDCCDDIDRFISKIKSV